MRMTILTSDDGDGSLSPVAWSHDGCMVRLGPARGPIPLFFPLACVNLIRAWYGKSDTSHHHPSWIEGQWVKRVTAVKATFTQM